MCGVGQSRTVLPEFWHIPFALMCVVCMRVGTNAPAHTHLCVHFHALGDVCMPARAHACACASVHVCARG